MATWIFLLCLRNLRLALPTMTPNDRQDGDHDQRQFPVHPQQVTNRKTTVSPSRMMTLIASVAAPVTIVTL